MLWYNRHALTRNVVLLLSLIILVSSAGCSPTGASLDGLASPTLRPYVTTTVSPQPSPNPNSTISSPTPGPTATPFIHVVQDGETLIYIASVHGITLEALLAANPGTDPQFLSIGAELLVPHPGADDAQDPLPLVTPVPVALSLVSCYRTPTDGLWCFTAAHGGTEETIEGLAVSITLHDARGGEIASETAYGPLNLLEPERTMPLAAFFTPPAPEYSLVLATLLTAFELAEGEDRYLGVDVALDVLDALPGSTRWHLVGTVTLAPWESASAERISLLVFALSSTGDIVGYSVWESPGAVAPGEQVSVELDLFSLGPSIARVETLAEAVISQ